MEAQDDKTLAFNAFKDPCLSLNNKQVELYKVDNYGFDGIRVDAARHISPEFLRSFPETGAPYAILPRGRARRQLQARQRSDLNL